MKTMKLKDVLDNLCDEVFVKITDFKDGVVRYLWSADYICGDEGTTSWSGMRIRKLLSKRIAPVMYLTIETNPETQKGKVPVLCVQLEHQIGDGIVRIPKDEVFNAIAKMNGFHRSQKVTDWYWDCDDDLVFCTNKRSYETEHYNQSEFCQQIGNHFGLYLRGCKVDYLAGAFVFKHGATT